jgi:DNA-directed RNA polymerase subunit RPC12/RpoP
VATFVRIAGFALFLAFGALGFAVVGADRDDESVSTTALIIRGLVPVFIGFVICWFMVELAERLDSRPCPHCGRRVHTGSYVCSRCGYDFRRTGEPVPLA